MFVDGYPAGELLGGGQPRGTSLGVASNTGLAKTQPSFDGKLQTGTWCCARGSWPSSPGGGPGGEQSPIPGCTGWARGLLQPWPCPEPPACREPPPPRDDLSPSPVCHRGARSSVRLRRGRREGKKHIVLINPSKILSFLPRFPSPRAAAGALPARGRQGQAGTAISLLIFCRCLFLAPRLNIL